MNEQDQKAFEAWWEEYGLGDQREQKLAWQAALAHRDAQPSAVNQQMLEALKESRQALQFANDSPNGGINDTIWMMHKPETLFDFMDAAIAAAEVKKE